MGKFVTVVVWFLKQISLSSIVSQIFFSSCFFEAKLEDPFEGFQEEESEKEEH